MIHDLLSDAELSASYDPREVAYRIYEFPGSRGYLGEQLDAWADQFPQGRTLRDATRTRGYGASLIESFASASAKHPDLFAHFVRYLLAEGIL